MAFEVTCGQCSGRLQVEQAGVVVACPHCGTHLNIASSPESTAQESAPQPGPAELTAPQVLADEPSQTGANGPVPTPKLPESTATSTGTGPPEMPAVSEPPASVAEEPATPDFSGFSQEPVVEEGAAAFPGLPGSDPAEEPALQAPIQESVAADQNESQSAESPPIVAEPPAVAPGPDQPTAPPAAFPVADAPADVFPTDLANETSPEADTVLVQPEARAADQPLPSSPDASTPTTDQPVAAAAPRAASQAGVSRPLFLAVASYASAMTIATVYLYLQLNNPTTSALENMPDVKPQRNKEQIAYPQVAEDQRLPPAHTLALGEERRYGNVVIKPLRVTRSPIEFVDHLGEKNGRTRPPGPEVVKLWLRIENASKDQRIAPLEDLVFRRQMAKGSDQERSNTFVCRESEKRRDGKLILVYDLNLNDVWNLRDQDVARTLDPGESFETYIPTTADGVAELTKSDEPLVWRVHFRKGFSPNRYGITTLIEVNFEAGDIKAETNPEPA